MSPTATSRRTRRRRTSPSRTSAAPPSAELALLLAGTEAARRAAAARVRALAGACEPAQLAAALEARRMLPLLGRRLLALAGEDALGAPFAAAVAAALTRDRAAAMALQHETQALVAALLAEGVRALPLKGPGLAERVHGDAGLRSAGDIDLLVRREDLERAAAHMRARGYAHGSDRLDRRGLPHLHHAMHAPGRPSVELHWRVHWHEEAFSRELLERAGAGPDGVLVPHPADEGAALLLFYARDGFYGLRMAADIGAWWDRYGAHAEAGLLAPHHARHPALARTWDAAALVAQDVAGVPAEAWTGRTPRARGRVALAVRLRNWSQRGERDQLAANVELVDGLLTPRRALHQFARRQALGAPGAVPVHLAKTTARFAAGLWRVRRRPWDPLPPAEEG